MRKAIIIPAVLIAGAAACAIGYFASQSAAPEKIDISSIHTTAAETMASEEASKPVSTEAPAETTAVTITKAPVTAEISTYQEGLVSIEYPVIKNTDDPEKEAKINQLLKDNAISVVKAYDLDISKDTIEITCKIIAADRKRITAAYTGILSPDKAAHPTNLFYSNTVDLAQIKDLGFNDYSDAYTMAGYVLSEDCEFFDTSEELTKELMTARLDMTIDQYTDLFRNADFPLKDSSVFPQSFSYEKEGVLYFSIPVAHVLGDYAIVKYSITTK